MCEQKQTRRASHVPSSFAALFSVVCVLILGLALSACTASTSDSGAANSTSFEKNSEHASSAAGQGSVKVFAAASLTEPMTKIADDYEAANPGVKIEFNFDSSGTLKTQIEQGAPADIFISAGQKQMDALEPKDLIDSSSRMNLVQNKVVLAGAKDAQLASALTAKDTHADQNSKPRELPRDFAALAKALKAHKVHLSIGNADVPAGQYALKIFDFFKLNEKELAQAGQLSYANNVKEVVSQVQTGAVPLGIMYQTDAFSSGLSVLDTATKEMAGEILYPAALTKSGASFKAAQKFYEYLKGSEAAQHLQEIGFTPLASDQTKS